MAYVQQADEKTVHWLLAQYLRLGCTFDQADALIGAAVDYRELERLLGKGCVLELAIRIVT